MKENRLAQLEFKPAAKTGDTIMWGFKYKKGCQNRFK